mmetsp:Transcript_25605/g.56462  ORF Transcript_25605/g.56462 Transcript_25605/m.56462 type:complete len:393 (+) Transcript_25605:98-1276(+)
MDVQMAVDLTDSSWLSSQLGRTVAAVRCEDMSNAGGFSGAMLRLHVTFCEGDSPAKYVVKRTKPGQEAKSKMMGFSREAQFYKELATEIPFVPLPKVFFAHVDNEAGTQIVIMEDLSDCVQAGHLFGPGSPLNWGQDLLQLTKGCKLSLQTATLMAFDVAAGLHATYWHCDSLKSRKWLRAADWYSGQGRAAWEQSQAWCADSWSDIKAKMDRGESDGVEWDPLLVSCLEASIARTDWAGFQAELQSLPFTLVHGDFHPGNMMIRLDDCGSADGTAILLLDFEQVGLGSGPQDLGQFMISHTPPEARQSFEKEAVRGYYAKLCQMNPAVEASLSWDACWQEYVAGGVGKWCWFLPVLSTMCPPAMMQYFHDQLLAFIVTHGVTPQSIGMPRA